MRYVILVITVLLVTACGKAPTEQASVPSPLTTAHGDRLWMLARASKVGDGRECKELYLAPDDPRYQSRVQQCDYWSRHYAEYLSLNGFPTIEHRHLQAPGYWQWFLAKRQSISDCWSVVGTLPVTANGEERAAHTRARKACDPYDNVVHNEGELPDELGIRHR